MKRFLITSKAFEGTAELIYNPEGELIVIDLKNSKMDRIQTQFFKTVAPIQQSEIHNAWGKSRLTIVEAEYEISFNDFWVKYDKKINKKRAEPLWEKLGKSKQVKAYFAIDAYDKYLKREEWRTKVDPDTFLKNEYWENEYK